MKKLVIHPSITHRDTDSMKQYLHDVSQYPQLTREEVVAVMQRIHQGDSKARDYMAHCNLRFVVSVAKQYEHCSELTLQDLISEGNIGLMKAIDHFDESYDNTFSTYAIHWIRQSIMDAMGKVGYAVRMSDRSQDKLLRIQKFVERYQADYHENPSTEDIADALDMEVGEVAHLQSVPRHLSSLDAPMGEAEDLCLGDTITYTDGFVPDAHLDKESDATMLRSRLNWLTARERQVITLLYGIGCEALSMTEVSERLELTYEACRQAAKHGVAKLRDMYLQGIYPMKRCA